MSLFKVLNVTYKQIGIKKVLIEWNHNSNYDYTISRYQMLINGTIEASYTNIDKLEKCM